MGVILKKSKTQLKLLHGSHDYLEDGTTRLRVVMQDCRRGWDNYFRGVGWPDEALLRLSLP